METAGSVLSLSKQFANFGFDLILLTFPEIRTSVQLQGWIDFIVISKISDITWDGHVNAVAVSG